MLDDRHLQFFLTAISAAALLAVSSGRRWALPTALTCAFLWGAWQHLDLDTSAVAPFRALASVLLIGLCWSLGHAARRPQGGPPLIVLILLPLLSACLGPLILAGALREAPWLDALQTESVDRTVLLLVGAVLVLPDGFRLAALPARNDARGGAFLSGLSLLVLLPVSALLSSLSALQSAEVISPPDSDRWPLPQLGSLVSAAAIGCAGAWILTRIGRSSVPGRATGAVDLATAFVPACAAEWLHPGTGPLAALLAGQVASTERAGDRLVESSRRRGGLGPRAVAWTLPAALVIGLGGLLLTRVENAATPWVGGATLWAVGHGLRWLTALAVGGGYVCLKPGRLDWRQVARVPFLSAPGLLTVAWLLVFVSGPQSALLSPELAASVVVAAVLGLLVDGTIAIVLERSDDRARHQSWELVRGRLTALRSAARALEAFGDRGDLARLAPADRESILESIELRRLECEQELEELLHDHPELRREGLEDVHYELTRATLRALDYSTRAGWVRLSAAEALRDEIAGWWRPPRRRVSSELDAGAENRQQNVPPQTCDGEPEGSSHESPE